MSARSARKYSCEDEGIDEYWDKYEWPIGQSISSVPRPRPSPEQTPELEHGAPQRMTAQEVDATRCGCLPRRRSAPSDDDNRGEARQIPKFIDPQFDPQSLDRWDVDDPAYLDKISCECLIKVTAIDPQMSRFELRMKCKWAFRTLHSDERTETKLRIPGIRLPGLIVEVNESRVWKDMQKTKESTKTVFWRGVSLFTITGFERFELQDFPFDRQLMSLDVFEFVWQAEKDSTDYDFSMHIVSFRMECVSMLPEWQAATPIIEAVNPRKQPRRDGEEPPPDYANRFQVNLRLERKNRFYLIQVFGLTLLITLASTLPLLTPASATHVGDRLGAYSTGVLTLTAFKYSIGEHLPSVPYLTKLDRIMLLEVCSIIFWALEALVAYRYVEGHPGVDEDSNGFLNTESVGIMENCMFAAAMVWWLCTFLHLSAVGLGLPCHHGVMRFKSWRRILDSQEGQGDFDELEDWDHKDGLESEKHGVKQLEALSLKICKQLVQRGKGDSTQGGTERTALEDLKEKRNKLEAILATEPPLSKEIGNTPPRKS